MGKKAVFWTFALIGLLLTIQGALADLTTTNIFWHSLDNADISGSTSLDETTNNNDGALINTPTTGITGLVNEGYQVNGANEEYINITNLNINGQTAFGLSVWLQTNSTDDMDFVSNFDGSGGGFDGFTARYKGADDDIIFWDGSSFVTVSTNTNVNDGSWHHLVFTYNSNTLMFFFDGTNTHNATIDRSTVDAVGQMGVKVGRDSNYGSCSRCYTGNIEEVAIWERLLTQTDINELYNSGNAHNPYNPIASTPYVIIELNNTYNGTALVGATVTLNNGSTGITDTNGNITFTGHSGSFNWTANKSGYFNITGTVTENGTAYGSMFMNDITLNCFSEKGDSVTCIQDKIYPDTDTLSLTLGAYFNASNYYYNLTDDYTFTGLQNTTLNITGFYNNIVGIIDETTLAYVTGLTCDVDGTTYTGNPMYIATYGYFYRNLTCFQNLVYPSTIWELNNTLANINLTMEEYKLKLYFDEIVNGTVTDIINVTSFENTTLVLKQTSLPVGEVNIRWQGGNSNSSQVMEYYNDRNQTVLAYLHIVNASMPVTKQVVTKFGGSPLGTVRVTAEEWDGTRYRIVYGVLTNVNGVGELSLEADKDYRITAQRTGYNGVMVIYPSVEDDTTILTLPLTKSGNSLGDYMITDCTGIMRESINCSFQIVMGNAGSQVSINGTTCYSDGTCREYNSTVSTTTGQTFQPMLVNSSTVNSSFSGYRDNVLIETKLINYDLEKDMTNSFTLDNLSKSEDDNVTWIVLLVIIGIFVGGLIEAKVRKGTGTYGFMAWLILWGTIFNMLYIFATVLGFFKLSLFIMKRLNN